MSGQKIANNPLGSFTATDDKNAIGQSRQAVGIDIGIVTDGVLTEDRVSSSNPLPVTGSVLNPESMVTYIPTRPQLLNNTAKEAIAANTNRKPGSYMQNNTAATIWGTYASATPIVGEGFKIYPNGGTFFFNTKQAIQVIQNSGSSVNLDVFEAT